MTDMNTDTDILASLVDEFEASAVGSLHSLFNVSNSTARNWQCSETMKNTFDYMLIIKSENEEYSSILNIGLSGQDLITIGQYSLNLDEAKDALTEFGNVFCGLINDIPNFKNNYGILIQKAPQEAVEMAFFPKMDVIEGEIYVNHDTPIYLAYGIKKQKQPSLGQGLLSSLLDDL